MRPTARKHSLYLFGGGCLRIVHRPSYCQWILCALSIIPVTGSFVSVERSEGILH